MCARHEEMAVWLERWVLVWSWIAVPHQRWCSPPFLEVLRELQTLKKMPAKWPGDAGGGLATYAVPPNTLGPVREIMMEVKHGPNDHFPLQFRWLFASILMTRRVNGIR